MTRATGQKKTFQDEIKDIDYKNGSYAVASYRPRDFSNLTPGVSGRPGLTNEDYYAFRPEEKPATEYVDAFKQCDMIYHKVGLIWNVINLMTDFTIKGIRVVHPHKKKEKLAREWFSKIEGMHVSERFVNYLYRIGNVMAQRYTAKIRNEDELAKAADLIGLPDGYKLEKKEIPWRYIFINPAVCEVVGGELARFVDSPLYSVKIAESLANTIKNPKSDEEKKLVQMLPKDLKQAILDKKPYILDPNRTIVYHFKKDDWRPWAFPIIYPIVDDITILQKLKLADVCALDSAASKIRIFKLGSLEHQIAPSEAAAEKLAQLLQNSVGGGTIDIVWGPDLELIESALDGYNFLGEEKYKPTLNAIFTALGVPITLTSAYSSAGAGNNYMALKTLTERLGYGRQLLLDFWQGELKLLAKALGWKIAPKIEFDQPILANEDTEKQLLIQLYDRNLISDEIIQLRFNMDSEMEKIRLNREDRERDGDRRVQKAGPWFNPQMEEKYTEIALQTGVITPSQVGLDLPDAKPKEIQQIKKLTTDPAKNPGIPSQGRPAGKKDSQKRKTKKLSVRTKGMLDLWANQAQDTIAKTLNPVLLAHFGKQNFRMLTNDEHKLAEQIKFNILLALEPFGEITTATIQDHLTTGMSFPAQVQKLKEHYLDFTSVMGREPTLDEIRSLQSRVYVELVQPSGEYE